MDGMAHKKQLAQRGSALLEYVVVMGLVLLTAVWAVGAWAEKRTELQVQATAIWMQALQQALERYIETYGQELIKASPYTPIRLDGQWVSDWQHPTIQELQQLGLLSTALNHAFEPPAWLWVFPQTPCIQEPCFLHALIVSQQPLQKKSGEADAYALGVWREITGGAGLAVQAPYEQWLAAAHFRWPNYFANIGSLPEGTIALAVQGEQLWSRYLLVRDERDPQFQA